MVLPQLAQQQLGYTATWAGLILSPGGAVVVLLIPIVGRAMQKFPLKYLIALGFFIMGCSLVYSHALAPNIDFWTLTFMRAFQVAGLAFLFVPISTIAFATLPKTSNADASALFTMFRNVSGSIAISLVTAMVIERGQVRQAYLVDHLTPLDSGYTVTLQQVQTAFLAQGTPASGTLGAATSWIFRTLQHQASLLAYTDVFLMAAMISFAVVPLAFFFSSKKGGGGGAPAH